MQTLYRVLTINMGVCYYFCMNVCLLIGGRDIEEGFKKYLLSIKYERDGFNKK